MTFLTCPHISIISMITMRTNNKYDLFHNDFFLWRLFSGHGSRCREWSESFLCAKDEDTIPFDRDLLFPSPTYFHLILGCDTVFYDLEMMRSKDQSPFL